MFAKYHVEEWEAYLEVNRLFCAALSPHLRSGDRVWIHDYHLMLLPEMLRKHNPDSAVAFFLHIPFPAYEIFRILPWHRQILKGLLASDLIGFHTYEYSQAFLGCARRVAGLDNTIGRIQDGLRAVQVDVFPMGIDFQRYESAPRTPSIRSRISDIKKSLKRRKLIFSLSRLDYTKGLKESIEAIGEFFACHPEWIGKVDYVLVVNPSRTKVERYAHLKHEIDELMGAVNSTYATMEWTPIRYIYRTIEFDELIALYAVADVALIIPLRDGMNLIAKEYIATRKNDTGVLILSEMAGAAKEMRDALIVNPNDRTEIVDALAAALTMPTNEQQRRNRTMKHRLKTFTVHAWAERLLARLDEIVDISHSLSIKIMTPEHKDAIYYQFRKSKNRLILLDYDGTLRDFADSPAAAMPSKEIIDLLAALARDSKNTVYLMSGRSSQTLDDWFGSLPINLVAEHGALHRLAGDTDWSSIQPRDDRWKKEIRSIMELFVRRIPRSFIEEKTFSLVWHYRMAESEIAADAARDLTEILTHLTANLDLRAQTGKKIVELKQTGVSKGVFFAKHLAGGGWDFILGIGDDWTDESLFTALPNPAISIRVGIEASASKFNIENADQVLAFLRILSGDTQRGISSDGSH
jgi:trehalose 6-phosphate synthase/phosphatase